MFQQSCLLNYPRTSATSPNQNTWSKNVFTVSFPKKKPLGELLGASCRKLSFVNSLRRQKTFLTRLLGLLEKRSKIWRHGRSWTLVGEKGFGIGIQHTAAHGNTLQQTATAYIGTPRFHGLFSEKETSGGTPGGFVSQIQFCEPSSALQNIIDEINRITWKMRHNLEIWSFLNTRWWKRLRNWGLKLILPPASPTTGVRLCDFSGKLSIYTDKRHTSF